MGIASMVIGILSIIMGVASLLISFIPGLGIFATCCDTIIFVPSIVGLVLGIVDIRKSKDGEGQKGMATVGIVLNSLALLIQIGTIVFNECLGIFINATMMP